MRIPPLLGALCISLFLSPWSVSGQDIDVQYTFSEFGVERVVVQLVGPTAGSLTTNLSGTKTTVRISGVNARYLREAGDKPLPGLVHSVTQVRRGIYTDLILLLRSASSLTATPGNQSLKLVIRAEETKGEKVELRNPVQISPAADGGKRVHFPSLYGVTPASRVLHGIGYALDLGWAALTGEGLAEVIAAQGGEEREAPPALP